MNPLVSIIIPVYNREELVQNTLDSILAQTYNNWECIVVDDDSTDKTYKVLQEYAKKDNRIKPYSRPQHLKKGANACRNFGFSKSKGEYVNWFDSDDIMYEDFIQAKVNHFLQNHPTSIAVYCSHDVLYEDTNTKVSIEIYETNNILKEYLLYDLKINTPSLMFKSDFLQNKALFNENITRGQETELYSRLFPLIENNEIGFVDKSLFLYFINSSSKSADIYNVSHINSRIYIYEDLLRRFGKDNDIKHKYLRDFHLLMYTAYTNKDFETFNIISKKLLDISSDFSFKIFHSALKFSIQNLGRGRALRWIENKNFRNYKIKNS